MKNKLRGFALGQILLFSIN